MLVCYTHRLGVINADALKSLFYRKIREKISKMDKLPESYIKALTEQKLANQSINFSTDLKMDYHEICSVLEGVANELYSGSLYLCVKDVLKKEIEARVLTTDKAFLTIEKIYAATLLDKGKTLIGNCNYGFNPTAVCAAMEKASQNEVTPEIEKMPLSFNMQYFMLEHGSRKLIEPHILQEMFLLRYFSILKTFKEAKVLQEDAIKQAFKIQV